MTLINIIMKSYSSILISIGSAAAFFFMLGSYLIIRLSRRHDADITLSESAAEPAEMREPVKKSRAISQAAPKKARKVSDKTMLNEALNDVSAISGEDPIATQLDLAKAYIESGKSQLAKIILASVIRESSSDYQDEAQRLLKGISS